MRHLITKRLEDLVSEEIVWIEVITENSTEKDNLSSLWSDYLTEEVNALSVFENINNKKFLIKRFKDSLGIN